MISYTCISLVLQTMVGRPPSANPSLTWTSQQVAQTQAEANAEQAAINAIIPIIQSESNAPSASFPTPAPTPMLTDVDMSAEQLPVPANPSAEPLPETPALAPLATATASSTSTASRLSALSPSSASSRVRSVSEMVTSPSARPAASAKASNRCEICNKKLTLAGEFVV